MSNELRDKTNDISVDTLNVISFRRTVAKAIHFNKKHLSYL